MDPRLVVVIVVATGALIALGSYYVLPDPVAAASRLRAETVAKVCGAGHAFWFEPQPDITAYELGQIVSKTSGGNGLGWVICDSDGKPIPADLLRHFRRIN